MKGFFRFCREANLGTKYSSPGWLTSVSYITLHQRPLFLFFTAPSRLLPTQYALFYYFIFGHWLSRLLGLPGWLSLKESTGSAGDAGMIPGSGRFSGGGNGTQPSIPAWKIPWTEELGGLQSNMLQNVKHNWMTEYACVHSRLLELIRQAKWWPGRVNEHRGPL